MPPVEMSNVGLIEVKGVFLGEKAEYSTTFAISGIWAPLPRMNELAYVMRTK